MTFPRGTDAATVLQDALAAVLPDGLRLLSARAQAAGVLAAGQALAAADVAAFVWVQRWPDAACGFGGIAAQVLTRAPTVVLFAPGIGAQVYHASRAAYLVNVPGAAFWQAVAACHLPGAAEPHDHLAGA